MFAAFDLIDCYERANNYSAFTFTRFSEKVKKQNVTRALAVAQVSFRFRFVRHLDEYQLKRRLNAS